MKVTYAIGALILAVLLSGQIRRAGAAEAVARAAEARADSLYVYALHVEQRRIEDSVTYAKNIARFEEESAAALARADRAASNRQRAVQRVIEVGGDSAAVMQAVVALEALHAIEVNGLRDALAVSDSIIATQRLQLNDYDYVNGQLRKALEASRAESRAWEKTSAPKLFGLLPVSPNTAFGGGALVTAGLVVWAVLR